MRTDFEVDRKEGKLLGVCAGLANRTGLAPGGNVREVEDKLMKVVPREYLQHAHHWLILHGRYVCKARRPECPVCPVADLCAYRHKTPAEADRSVRAAE